MGQIHSARQDYQAAFRHYQLAQELDPNEVDAYLKSGRAYYELQLYPMAVFEIRMALMRNKRLPEAYLVLGHINYELGEFEAALENYRRVIDLDSQCAMARFRSALIYLRLADEASAREAAACGARLDPALLESAELRDESQKLKNLL